MNYGLIPASVCETLYRESGKCYFTCIYFVVHQ